MGYQSRSKIWIQEEKLFFELALVSLTLVSGDVSFPHVESFPFSETIEKLEVLDSIIGVPFL